MDGQQGFLTSLTRNKGKKADPKTRKRKAPDGGKAGIAAQGKGNQAATKTDNQVSKAKKSGSKEKESGSKVHASESAPQAIAIITPQPAGVQPPPHSSNLPPPPPPTGPTIRPPKRFYDPVPYNNEIIRELQDMELQSLRAISLTQTLASVHAKYWRAVGVFRTAEADKVKLWTELETCRTTVNDKEKILAKLQVFQEEKNKTYEEILKVKEDSKTANRDLLAFQKNHANLKAKYEILDKKVQGHENNLAEAREKLEKTEDELKDVVVEAVILRSDLSDSVQGSFMNALNQIKFLNPGIELNLSGFHHLAFVNDGKLIPPPSPSPSWIDGEVEMIDEDEEVKTENPVVADALNPPSGNTVLEQIAID